MNSLRYCLPLLSLLLATANFSTMSSAQGSWSATEDPITPSPNGAFAYDRFGGSLDVEDDRVAVGAPHAFLSGLGYNGSVDTYLVVNETLVLEQRITSPIVSFNDNFGTAVELDGDLLYVGEPSLTTLGGSHDGVVEIFRLIGGVWTFEERLTYPGLNIETTGFGADVKVDGDTLAVGAPSSGFCPDKGHVVIYRDIAGTWVEEQVIEPSDVDRNFGRHIDLQGDTLFVSNPSDESSSGLGDGGVRIYTRSGVLWTLTQTLFLPGATSNAGFGSSLVASGDRLLVSASNQNSGQGVAVAFRKVQNSWQWEATLTPDDATSPRSFGGSVDLQGDLAVISSGSGGDAGADESLYLFRAFGSNWQQETVGIPAPIGTTTPGVLDVALFKDGNDSLGLLPNMNPGGTGFGMLHTFRFGPLAGVTTRNAGSNPLSYTANAPQLGGTLNLSVDLAGTTGHSLALPFAFFEPSAGIPVGGSLVLVDPFEPAGELFGLAGPAAGPIATFALPIPDDPSLAGLGFSSQALHFVGISPFALSNALDFLIGE